MAIVIKSAGEWAQNKLLQNLTHIFQNGVKDGREINSGEQQIQML
jgi:hypothetical protein